MSESKCLILGPEFVYAVIDNNVEIESDRELPLANWGKKGTVFQCADGNLEGFDVKLGEFKAPKDGFYTISFFCRYNVSNPTPVTGLSYTKMSTFKEYNKAQSISPLGNTNPFARWKKSYISASSLSGSIPLSKGEGVFFSLYQKNSVVKKARVEAELIIKYESSYKNAIDSNIYIEDIRCGKVEEAKGLFELRTTNRNFVQYALKNPMNPFDRLEVSQDDGKKTTFYPLDFNKINIIYSDNDKIVTNSKKLLEEVELTTFSGEIEIEIAEINIFYGDGKKLSKKNITVEPLGNTDVITANLIKAAEKKFIEFVVDRNMDGVNDYIDLGLNLNFVDANNKSPLTYAIENIDLDMVKNLVESGAKADFAELDAALSVPFYEETEDDVIAIREAVEIYDYIQSKAPSIYLKYLKDALNFAKRFGGASVARYITDTDTDPSLADEYGYAAGY